MEIFKSHDSVLLVFDIKSLKCNYRLGLETLLVYTMNVWAS